MMATNEGVRRCGCSPDPILTVAHKSPTVVRTTEHARRPGKAFYISLRDLKSERRELRSRSHSRRAGNESEAAEGNSRTAAPASPDCFENVKSTVARWNCVKKSLCLRTRSLVPSSPRSSLSSARLSEGLRAGKRLRDTSCQARDRKSNGDDLDQDKANVEEDSNEWAISRPKSVSPTRVFTAIKKADYVPASPFSPAGVIIGSPKRNKEESHPRPYRLRMNYRVVVELCSAERSSRRP